MNLAPFLPLASLHLAPGIQILGIFFASWALTLFVVLHLDGNRAK